MKKRKNLSRRMIIGIVLFFHILIKFSSGVRLTIEEATIKPSYAAVAVFNNCTRLSLISYYDKSRHKWLTDSSTTLSSNDCSINSPKHILSYCQRAYPTQNIVNIIKMAKNTVFTLKTCQDEFEASECVKSITSQETASIYKCLNGSYSAEKLNTPENCELKRLFNNKECRSDEQWIKVMNEKCASTKAYLYDFKFLQSCDAFVGGFSSFYGVMFACCNLNVNKPTQSSSVTSSEDDNIDYLNEDSIFTTNVVTSSNKPSEESDEIEPDVQLTKTISETSSNENGSRTMPIFIILLIISTIVFVLIKKRLSRGKNSNRLAVPVSANDCPETNHINSMQVNGYENPTYKFFELQT